MQTFSTSNYKSYYVDTGETITKGDLVYFNSIGKVKKSTGIDFGDIYSIRGKTLQNDNSSTDPFYAIHGCAMNDNTFVIAYIAGIYNPNTNQTAYNLYARVITENNGVLTFGTECSITTTQVPVTNHLLVSKINDTSFLVIYPLSGYYYSVKITIVNSNSFTYDSPVYTRISTGTYNMYPTLIATDANKFVFGAQRSGGSGGSQYCVITIFEASHTCGTVTTLGNTNFVSLNKLDNSTLVAIKPYTVAAGELFTNTLTKLAINYETGAITATAKTVFTPKLLEVNNYMLTDANNNLINYNSNTGTLQTISDVTSSNYIHNVIIPAVTGIGVVSVTNMGRICFANSDKNRICCAGTTSINDIYFDMFDIDTTKNSVSHSNQKKLLQTYNGTPYVYLFKLAENKVIYMIVSDTSADTNNMLIGAISTTPTWEGIAMGSGGAGAKVQVATIGTVNGFTGLIPNRNYYQTGLATPSLSYKSCSTYIGKSITSSSIALDHTSL
jgi:hypothetical protein